MSTEGKRIGRMVGGHFVSDDDGPTEQLDESSGYMPSDTDVTFRLDDKTSVVARGAGRKMRRAQADGAPGIKLADSHLV